MKKINIQYTYPKDMFSFKTEYTCSFAPQKNRPNFRNSKKNNVNTMKGSIHNLQNYFENNCLTIQMCIFKINIKSAQ